MIVVSREITVHGRNDGVVQLSQRCMEEALAFTLVLGWLGGGEVDPGLSWS